MRIFGTIGVLLDAPAEVIIAELPNDGDVANAIIAGRDIASIGVRESFFGMPVRADDPSLLAYLARCLSGRRERIHTVYLTDDELYIQDEGLATGSRDRVHLKLRDILGRAMQLNAAKLIVAHNHPSGQCRPSGEDIRSTRQLVSTAAALDISIVDHLIVSGSRTYSMREGGEL